MSSTEPARQSDGAPASVPATPDAPVRRSITVKASAERAFDVFTAGIDRWWPRSHHIGKAPMKRCLVEGRVGGRCYSEQADGTECDWGEITEWEPPRRFVMAWKITAQWQYEPDLAKSSEVEVRFTPLAGGSTRVDLEHRHFERMGAGWESMRGLVDGEGGWGGLLQLFGGEAERSN
ncbi:MAG: SRPBCC family protein [Candidatus Acidiferrum sp.]